MGSRPAARPLPARPRRRGGTAGRPLVGVPERHLLRPDRPGLRVRARPVPGGRSERRMSRSEELFARARRVIPGGVNSPVRAFKAVGGSPRFIESASGARVRDVDGREYIDYLGSWGPMILGHAPAAVLEAISRAAARGTSYGAPCPAEVELAERVTRAMPSIEKVRFVSSGTEATMSALRLARGFTCRSRILKFDGCYHGHADSLLVAAGSGVATLGIP